MSKEKILIIEDNQMNMELATDLLELAGYVVVQAEIAEKGIDLAKVKSFDLILMDIGLPKMDGLTATKILKQDPVTKDIPVVALTAHAMSGDKEKMSKAGCEGYITKPINTREFAKNVSNSIRRSKLSITPA